VQSTRRSRLLTSCSVFKVPGSRLVCLFPSDCAAGSCASVSLTCKTQKPTHTKRPGTYQAVRFDPAVTSVSALQLRSSKFGLCISPRLLS